MNLYEFVNSLTIEAFESLRVAVIDRQTRQAEQFAAAFEYLVTQPALMKAAQKNRIACINVMSEKTKLPRALMTKVVDKYLESPEQFTGNPIAPFGVKEVNRDRHYSPNPGDNNGQKD